MVDIFSIEYWERYCIEDYNSMNEYLYYIISIKELGERDFSNANIAWHHIVPKSFSDDLKSVDYNYIALFPREHFIAHMILSKCFRGIYKCKMDKAVFIMSQSVGKEIYDITPEEYEISYNNFIESMSKNMSGENNPMYGIRLSGELNPMYRHNWTEEERERMSGSIKKWWENNHYRLHPDNKGEKNPFYGKRHTEESKKKISESLKGKAHPIINKYDFSGENNPMYGKTGDKNPNYGKHFINNGIRNKMAKEYELDEYLNNGWVTGKIRTNISEDVL